MFFLAAKEEIWQKLNAAEIRVKSARPETHDLLLIVNNCVEWFMAKQRIRQVEKMTFAADISQNQMYICVIIIRTFTMTVVRTI